MSRLHAMIVGKNGVPSKSKEVKVVPHMLCVRAFVDIMVAADGQMPCWY